MRLNLSSPVLIKAWPYAAGALLLALALGAASGGYASYKWMSGKVERAERRLLEKERDDAVDAVRQVSDAAEALRADAAAASIRRQEAARRMESIANQLETQRHAIEKFQQQQKQSLESLLRQHPDLRYLDLGDDILRHWNQSNKGAATGSGSAPATTPAKRDAAVSALAPGCGVLVAGTARQPRCGHGGLPRLPGDTRGAGRVGPGVAGNGTSLVLLRAQAHQPSDEGLRQ
ncbi:hypothetical protein V3390_00185 [Luteimonas sp. FXH3W]|uniref:Uncharacterized protein n=1 Tax=Aquilutibacter rugosus TaxID=3115820 RepID=A0ABU7UW58_9GAMM